MKEKIRNIILSLGADVCGFANIERFKDIPEQFAIENIFKECKSVIVFGVALPRGVMEISPRIIYGHFNYFACSEVDGIAFKGAKKIEELTKKNALPIPSDSPYEYWKEESLTGHGIISIKHAAVAAGLGEMGKSSLFLNKKYGNRLILGAIITDIDLPSDDIVTGICIEKCRKCLESCPVKAINEDKTVTQKLCRNNAYGKTSRGFDIVECNKCRTVCPMRFGKDD